MSLEQLGIKRLAKKEHTALTHSLNLVHPRPVEGCCCGPGGVKGGRGELFDHDSLQMYIAAIVGKGGEGLRNHRPPGGPKVATTLPQILIYPPPRGKKLGRQHFFRRIAERPFVTSNFALSTLSWP